MRSTGYVDHTTIEVGANAMGMIQLADGRAIGYEQRGSGPDLVWVSGGGIDRSCWIPEQVPAFMDYRNTIFDNRGVGVTRCPEPLPWSVSDMARDAADLIKAVCKPPVFVVGLSMGALIVQALAIEHPELVRLAIPMGTAARASGWLLDYMQTEIEYRKAGHQLDDMMAACHYLPTLYPSSALSDPELYPKLKKFLLEWLNSGDNERSLIGQWEACCTNDQTEALKTCKVPIHVIGFGEDIQAPPIYGRQVADLAPRGVYHQLDGLGHTSLHGHAPDRVNRQIRRILESVSASAV